MGINTDATSVYWNGFTATISYFSATNYTIVGQSVFELTLPLCVVAGELPEISTAAVCGNDNDTVIHTGAVPVGVMSEPEVSAWSNNTATVTWLPEPGWAFGDDTVASTIHTDEGPCLVAPFAVEAPVAVCGDNNDVIELPTQPEGVEVTDTGWIDNERVVTFSPADGYMFTDDSPVTQQFTDSGRCTVTPLVIENAVAVCGPNNDAVTKPGQPENVEVTDTGWVDNVRVITLIPAEDYAFPDGTRTTYEFTDENALCEVPPVERPVVIRLNAANGLNAANASLEGTPYTIVTPDGSIQGAVGAGNLIEIDGLLPGTYTLIVDAPGYLPLEEVFDVSDGVETLILEFTLVLAPSPTLVPTETPTEISTQAPTEVPTQAPTEVPTQVPTEVPTAAPTDVPTTAPTVAPTASSTSAPVSSLPNTGGGSSGEMGVAITFLAMGMAMVAVLALNRRYRS